MVSLICWFWTKKISVKSRCSCLEGGLPRAAAWHLLHVAFQPCPGLVAALGAVQQDFADVFCLVDVYFVFVPWVLFDLFESRALVAVLVKDLLHKVLELGREMRSFQGLPVGCIDAILITLASCEELVELIFLRSHAEREVSDDQGEQDDAHGEDICLLAVVGLAAPDLRGHVALSAPE